MKNYKLKANQYGSNLFFIQRINFIQFMKKFMKFELSQINLQ